MAFKDKQKAIEGIKTRKINSPMFDNYRNDLDFARKALEKDIRNIQYLGETIKKNYGFASMVCERNPILLRVFDNEIKSDPMFVKKVIFRVLESEETILMENGTVWDLKSPQNLLGLSLLADSLAAKYQKNKAAYQDTFARMLYVSFGDELRKKMIEQGGDDFFKRLLLNHYDTMKDSIYKLCEKLELKDTLTLELSREPEPVKRKVSKI